MSWKRILGHERWVKAFDRVARRGRLGQAYLFTGPSGIGKRTFAGELAKALLCEGREDFLEACDHCPSCLQMDSSAHPDFFSVSRPENSLEVPIEAIRELSQNFALKSARGKGKIAILDNADDLNDAAANCFLKTLEEPPPQSLLILVGTGSEHQLATIVSRCQVIRFAPLAHELVLEVIKDKGYSDLALVDRLGRMADGSPGQALALADPALWDFRNVLMQGLLQRRPDGIALAKSWMEFSEDAGKEAGAQRQRTAQILRLLIEAFHDALHVSVGRSPSFADGQELRSLQELAQRLGAEALIAVIDRCLEAERHIDRHVQLVLALEALLDDVCQKLDIQALSGDKASV